MICRYVVLTAFALRLAPAADVRVVEEIAAKVNGEIVTRGEITEQRRLVETYFRQEQHLSGTQLQAAIDEQTKDILREKIDQIALMLRGAIDAQSQVGLMLNVKREGWGTHISGNRESCS